MVFTFNFTQYMLKATKQNIMKLESPLMTKPVPNVLMYELQPNITTYRCFKFARFLKTKCETNKRFEICTVPRLLHFQMCIEASNNP